MVSLRLKERFQEREANPPGLLRMELRREKTASAHGRSEVHARIGRTPHGMRIKLRIIRVDEVELVPRPYEPLRSIRLHIVPAYLGDLEPLDIRKSAHLPRKHPEEINAPILLGMVEEDLHPKANADERPARRRRLAHRIREAKRLLDSTQSRVNEVAEQVGYRDITYFSRKFRSIVGLSPSEYKKQAGVRRTGTD